ncbi:hypothetical protein F2Q68_00005293 [Brassica cretica]|uniref:Uncharacterized protein n=1 Tax=Brassica cretica TaxID=69181 RepID=A0A8S9JN75_BRACR|nr:hypothetical protein F2Q68_00005293 [Brassica cretica]
MKTTQQSINHNSQFLVDRGLDPKPDFCDPNPFSTFSSRPTSRLVLNWSSLDLISLHLNRTFSRGGRGIFIDIISQSDSSRVSTRVPLRMAPESCATTPHAPLGRLHVSLSCRMTPRPLPARMHGLAPCKETPRPPHGWPHGLVACIATPRAWPIHLVLLCVTPHAVIIFTTTPHASLATYHSRQLPPRPHLIDRATSSFSIHSSDFGLSGGRGLFIGSSNQSETSRVAARVSLRMAPDACAAGPRAPLVFQHGLLTYKVTPCPLPVWMHGLAPCKKTPCPPHVRPHDSVACITISRAWPFHLVLLCVTPHTVVIFTATPHASLATYHARQLPPRPDLIDRATSSFSVHSSNFGISGDRGLFIDISSQSDSSLVSARVSLRMAPDACAATPRAPHGRLHVSVSCRMTPRPLPSWMHGLAPCKETPRPPHARPHDSVACITTSRAWPFHLVLLCVTPQTVVIFTATPHASLATYHARHLPPRPDLIDRATSSFSVHSSNFGISGEFFVPRSIPIFFDACSDDLIIFNKLQMNPDLTENIFSVPPASSKNS